MTLQDDHMIIGDFQILNKTNLVGSYIQDEMGLSITLNEFIFDKLKVKNWSEVKRM